MAPCRCMKLSGSGKPRAPSKGPTEVDEKLAYVTRRTNANGKVRWYWQRPGHKLTRLPDDPVERFREGGHAGLITGVIAA